MSHLDALWAYQQIDMQVVKYESEIRQDPMRRKLVKLRNYYKEQQDAMKAEQKNAEKAEQLLDLSKQQYDALQKRLDEQSAHLSEADFAGTAEIKKAIDDLNDIIAKLNALEIKLGGTVREAERVSQALKTAMINAAKAKNDYTTLKTQYDEKLKEQTKELEKLIAQRDINKPGIAPAVLAKYEGIKKRCMPPVATLEGDKCSGCNMSLPAMLIDNARKADTVVECETCGRIIYIAD